MAQLSEKKVEFLFAFYERLLDRAFLLDICSALGRHPVHESVALRNAHWNFKKDKEYAKGDIVVIANETQKVVAYVVDETDFNGPVIVCNYLCDFSEAENTPLFDAIDTFVLDKNETFHVTERITTTFGRFFFNYAVWYSNGVEVEYNNEKNCKSSFGSSYAPVHPWPCFMRRR